MKVDKQNKYSRKRASFSSRTVKTQGNSILDILVIIVVILTVFGFMLTMVFGDGEPADASTTSTTTSRSTTVSSTNEYPYTQPTTTYAQPTYSQSLAQNSYQGRAGFQSVSGDINATGLSTVATGAIATGTVAGVASNNLANQGSQSVSQANSINAYGMNGEVISLNPIQPLATPYIPTTAPAVAITGRAAITPGSNPAAPYNSTYNTQGNASIYIDSVQTYRPQNQELMMNQACVNEVWQRNPYVIRNFSNLSVRLSATNPTANGNMRTYSFNLDNRPTGNGALCTVTSDGYVTAVSFY